MHVSNLLQTLFTTNFSSTFAGKGLVLSLAALCVGLIQSVSQTDCLETFIALVSSKFQRFSSKNILVGVSRCLLVKDASLER